MKSNFVLSYFFSYLITNSLFFKNWYKNYMNGIISSIHFSPIKSLSFTNIESCEIKKNLGILDDRKFAFSRIIDKNKALLIQKNPNKRKLDNFLSLKNSPGLKKYSFTYTAYKLT